MSVSEIKATRQQRRALELYLTNGGDKLIAYEAVRTVPINPRHTEPRRRGLAERWFNQPTMRKLMDEANFQARLSMERKQIAGLNTAIETYGITKDRILGELAKIAFAQATDVMSWGPDGVVVKDSADLGDAAAAVGEVVSSGGGDKSPMHIKVKLLDKRQALLDLGKELGMFTDKVEHKGTVAVAAKFIVEGR